jgi:hypothetical protein
MLADEALHRHAVENLNGADALLFGRVTYQMMEAAFRSPRTGAMPEWTEPFARTIDAARKYVVSSSLERVDWNAELVRGNLAEGTRRQKLLPDVGRNGLTNKVPTVTFTYSAKRLVRELLEDLVWAARLHSA